MTKLTDKSISQRARKVTPFIVMEILERAQAIEAAGEHVVHMEIGEPDFNTPGAVKAAARRALDEDRTKYTHSLGMTELRRGIAGMYARQYGVKVEPEQVVVTTGSSAGMLLTFASLIDPGDEVVVTNPAYPCYVNFIRLFGGVPVFLPMGEAEGWQVSAERLAALITEKTKAVIINSPSNPTGILLSAPVMADIARVCRGKCLIISDEIYHGMVYEGHAHTALEFTPEAIVINGFSKLHAMTGWRLGFLIVPEGLVRPVQKFQQNLFISAPTLAQEAALAALDEARPDIEKMVKLYDKRRRWLVPRLRELGFGIAVEPTGAFYVLANANHLGHDSYALAVEILEKAKVAVTPGIDFGSAAEGYLRFSYANSLDEIMEGCRRLEVWLSAR